MLIRDYLGLKPVDGDVGLELEVEAERPLPEGRIGSWSAKADGSLRGRYNMEYITKPIKCDNKKLGRIEKLIKEITPSQPDPNSNRTSLHVHVNVLEHSFTELMTSVCTYWLLDNLMVEYCGPERSGCIYCLRLKDAEALVKITAQSLHDYTRPLGGIAENVRYSSQNLASVGKLGTLEYRAMRGTLDPEVIDRWSTNLFLLVDNSKKFWKTPSIMMDAFWKMKKKDFLDTLFDYSFVKELTSIKGWEDMIQENVGIVCDVAYMHDWSAWESRMDNYYGKGKAAVVNNPAVFDIPDMRGAVPRRRREAVPPQRDVFGRVVIQDDVPAAQAAPANDGMFNFEAALENLRRAQRGGR
jgi:hypothetical protein